MTLLKNTELRLLLFLLPALLFVNCARQAETPTSSEAPSNNPILKQGDYLREEILAKLGSGSGPIQAEYPVNSDDYDFQMGTLRMEEGRPHLFVGSFHEDGYQFVLTSGEFRSEAPPSGAPTADLSVLDAERFVITVNGKKKTFRHVGDAEQRAAVILLAGRYVDQQGQTYLFKDDGTVLFPDGEWAYRMDLDLIGDRQGDHLKFGKLELGNKFKDMTDYQIRKKGDSLELYELKFIDETGPGRKPSLIPKWRLKRVTTR